MPVTVKVRDVMDMNVYFIPHDKTVMDAVQLMLEKGVWSLVVTRGDLPVGVITERDIIRRAVAKKYDLSKIKVEEIMSSPILTIDPDKPLSEALNTMVDKSVRRLYVVEKGKIVGRITQTESFRQLLNVLMALSQLPYQL